MPNNPGFIVVTPEQLKELIKDSIKEALTATPEQSVLITSSEVMQLCKISTTTLQKWRDNKKIPFTKNGNKIYYNKAEVLQKLLHA